MGISPSATLVFEALRLLLFIYSTSAIIVRLPVHRDAIVYTLPCFPVAKEQSRRHTSKGTFDTPRLLANDQAQKVLHGAPNSYSAAAGPLHECDVVYHLLFTSNVTLGTPPQPFIARVDINWADMFVPSAPCMRDPDRDCAPFHKLNSNQSSTYIATTTFSAIDYEGLGTSGHLAQDTLSIGNISITNQTFEAADDWRSMYGHGWAPLDSGLGLTRFRAPRRHPESGYGNWPLRNMIDQGLLDRNVFSLRLPRTGNDVGELILGGVDDKQPKPIIKLPLTNKTFISEEQTTLSFLASSGWQADISGMSLQCDGQSDHLFDVDLQGVIAVFSNSFDFISFPFDIARAILDTLGIEDEALPDPPCERLSDLPNLTFAFGEQGEITLAPRQYTIRVQSPYGGERCIIPFTSWAHNDVPDEVEGDYVVLGTAFLNHLLTVFDMDGETISCRFRVWGLVRRC
ncbi:acid protease [Lophium mytilinum]|uniref:Acid protease n=1 Tax=Lophium mytilinum TaxID=390894 RepID=A0A6A6R2D5_9PEZI|nr:acid protease [Lophium mytilinum]